MIRANFNQCALETEYRFGSPITDVVVMLALVVAFADESVRFILPGTPVIVTAVKDALLLLAGGFLVVRGLPLGRYVGFFMIWVLISSLSGLLVFAEYGSYVHLLGIARTYALGLLIFAVGYHLARRPRLLSRLGYIFVAGCVLALTVGVAQEFARDALPAFWRDRIWTARHSGASGFFVDSIFNSPLTFGVVLVVLLAWLLDRGVRKGSTWSIALLSLWASYGIYLTRRRAIIAFGAAVLLLQIILYLRTMERHVWARAGQFGFGVSCLAGLYLAISLALIPDASLANIEDAEKEARFFAAMTELSYLEDRGMKMVRVDAIPEGLEWVIGQGVGTGGRFRSLINEEGAIEAFQAADRGWYLILWEMGILGLLGFVFCYVGLQVHCLLRIWTKQHIDPVAIVPCCIALFCLLQFTFKAPSVMANGLMHGLWLTSLGLACGLLDRPVRGGERRKRASTPEGKRPKRGASQVPG